MLYLAWDREINILLFFATFLYENEAPSLEQAVVVTMATRVLRPLKRAFLCIPPERITACKILRGLKIFISQDVWFLQRLVLIALQEGVNLTQRVWHRFSRWWPNDLNLGLLVSNLCAVYRIFKNSFRTNSHHQSEFFFVFLYVVSYKYPNRQVCSCYLSSFDFHSPLVM